MKWVVAENTWLTRDYGNSGFNLDFGWGNGYVAIPAGRPYHGVVEYNIPVDIEGGLSFSGPGINWDEFDNDSWVVGFDTAHYRQTLADYPKERVIEMTMDLRRQLVKLCYPLLE